MLYYSPMIGLDELFFPIVSYIYILVSVLLQFGTVYRKHC